MPSPNTIIQPISAPCQKPVRKVLILNHQWLAGAAIASLLSQENDFEISGLTALCTSALFDIIDKFSLDVIIVDNLMASDDEIESLCAMLRDHPTAYVLIIYMEINAVCLDGLKTIAIVQVEDLAELLRHQNGHMV